MRIVEIGFLDIMEISDVILMAHLAPVITVDTNVFCNVSTITKTQLKVKLVNYQ